MTECIHNALKGLFVFDLISVNGLYVHNCTLFSFAFSRYKPFTENYNFFYYTAFEVLLSIITVNQMKKVHYFFVSDNFLNFFYKIQKGYFRIDNTRKYPDSALNSYGSSAKELSRNKLCNSGEE